MKIKLTDTRTIFALMMIFAAIAFVDGILIQDAANFAGLSLIGKISILIAMIPLVYWLGAFIVSAINKFMNMFK